MLVSEATILCVSTHTLPPPRWRDQDHRPTATTTQPSTTTILNNTRWHFSDQCYYKGIHFPILKLLYKLDIDKFHLQLSDLADNGHPHHEPHPGHRSHHRDSSRHLVREEENCFVQEQYRNLLVHVSCFYGKIKINNH